MLINEHDFAGPINPLLAPVIYWFFQAYFYVVHLVYCLLNFVRKRHVVPRISANNEQDALLLLPAVRAARKIWLKEITSAQLVEAYIQRAELVNKQINAIVQRNYDFARNQAKTIDYYVQSLNTESQEYEDLLNKKPFLGVPLSVKDHIGVKGLKLTIGLPCFIDNPPAEDDAEVVKRLINAGAIPFVYSNVPEGLMWIETENTIYGRTKNAYDSRKGVGGSSGGEGALLSAGASIIGIGSDIGGSVRIPAMFNGVFGLKPTPKLITWKGCIPSAFVGYQAEMASLGPLCRYVDDLRPMLKLMVDPELVSSLRLDKPVDISTLRFFYMESPRSIITSPLFADVANALQKAVNHFQNVLSKSTIRIDLPLMNYVLDLWFVGMCDEGAMPVPNFFTGFNPDRALNGWAEFPKFFTGTSQHTLPTIIWCILYDFFSNFSYDPEKRIKMREVLRSQLLDLLDDNGILLTPSFPQSGYFHNELIFSWTHMQATSIWNALAFPAVMVPMGLNSDNFPTAVQVVTTPGNERLLIKVAEELSAAFGGWQMPPGTEQQH